MKKILVLFLFTLIYQTSFSQSRTNKVIPKFEESSPEIKKAVGWALNNTTGKWIENANCIFQSENRKIMRIQNHILITASNPFGILPTLISGITTH